MPDFKPWQWATLITLLIALNIVVVGGLIVVIVTYDLWANPAYLATEPTVPPWATPTATQRPTFTPTYTPETWPTATITRTPTRTPSPTPTWTPLPTRTPWWTETPYRAPAGTPTHTQIPTHTSQPTMTFSASPTWTQTPTASSTPTSTHTPSPTYTVTPQPTSTWTATPTHTASPTPTSIPTSTRAPTSTRVSVSSLDTPTPRSTPTHIPSPTLTITPTALPSSTHTPSPSPSATATTSPTPTATPSPSSTATATLSPSPTATRLPTPTPTQSSRSSLVSDAQLMEAVLLTDRDISLSWEPVAGTVTYRVYSDMGTGYGVYVYEAQTEEHKITDSNRRPGLRYQYRIRAVAAEGESAIAWAHVVIPYHPDSHVRSGADSQAGRRSLSTGSQDIPALTASQPSRSSVRVTPAPTPLPPDTVILGLLSATDYGDDVDQTLTIVGEVRNDSHLDVGQTTVTATFYGTDGQIIGEGSGSTMLQALAPGIRSPFMITLPRPPGLADYSLRATGRPVSLSATDTQVSVVNTRRFEDPAGFYHIAGVIENRSKRRVEGARVIVTLYDRAGNVINVGFAYPQPSSLSPNDRADFDVTFTYYPKVYSHLAVAVGN